MSINNRDTEIRSTPLVAIIAAWVVVAIPLGWGIYSSVKKARPLFQEAGASPAPAVVKPPLK